MTARSGTSARPKTASATAICGTLRGSSSATEVAARVPSIVRYATGLPDRPRLVQQEATGQAAHRPGGHQPPGLVRVPAGRR